MGSRQHFFDEKAETWEEDNPVSAGELDRVVDYCEVEAGQRVLDVGTGTGRLVSRLLERVGPGGAVRAVDPSPGMLAAARKRHRADNLEFVEAAAEDLPFPDTAFDRAVCYAVYPHFSCARTAVNELFRVLRTGGQLAVLHTVGRQELNALHGQAGAAVRSDRLPPARSAAKLLANSGFEVLHYIDTEDFYALKAEKRRD